MRKGDNGFTLVEMLISILLLVLVTGMLFEGLRLVSQHLGRETGRLDRSSQIALVQIFLRAQLADAQPITRPDAAVVTVDFAGDTDHLVFVAPAPPSVVFGGLGRLSLDFAADRGTAGHALRADWRPYRVFFGNPSDDGAGDAPVETSRVLLDDVKAAVFSYFGSTAVKQAPAWHDSWQGMKDLPLLVRLSVVFSDGQTMPELIVALRLATTPE
jgi:general secretion pathway protein J